MGECNFKEIETKWQRFWAEDQTFSKINPHGEKFYCLDMFPYPSGAGLHLGHPVGYTATDIYSRYKRHRGFNVLHPMGWDAFGLPAEQHAIATGEHPSKITEKNCQKFKDQINSLGYSYDWNKEVYTCRADYYRWTQWIFLKIYNSWFDEGKQCARPISELSVPEEVIAKGPLAIQEYEDNYRLAIYTDAMVNWCPALGTVLANEEVIDGKSERGGFDVIRKPMKQWVLRITKYAERLLAGLDSIDWPDSIKEQQRNWIGKKNGARIKFPIAETDNQHLTAFTTRPDTLFGVTFFVLSPEHPAVESITTDEQKELVSAYCLEARKLSDFARTLENRKKTGVFTGGYCINPVNNTLVPVYVGDYVLMSVGTGAVMGVPAHDERDFEFARTFNLDVLPVIKPVNGQSDQIVAAVEEGEIAWTGDGIMIDFEVPLFVELQLSGVDNNIAAERIVRWLEEKGWGQPVVNYKLRDWLFSRQRYWGEPIPIVHWEDGTRSALQEEDLPLLLPQVEDYKPSESGQSALAKAGDWLVVVDSRTGKRGQRETNTMPQWAGSCWYYLRFTDPHNKEQPWCESQEKKWIPVDLYVGGAEHAVLHLLYARFWHKVLYDLGYVNSDEPFRRLVNQGMLLAYAYRDQRGALVSMDQVLVLEDGSTKHKKTGEKVERIIAKMSKSLRNVVTPDEVTAQFSADTLRLYIMFMGPLEASRVFDWQAINGVHRFLKRAWIFVEQKIASAAIGTTQEDESTQRAVNLLVKRVTEETENLRFNTAIAAMMEFLNEVYNKEISKQSIERFVVCLSPYAAHLAEELWQLLGNNQSVSHAPWPAFDQTKIDRQLVDVVIQVNGRKRAIIQAAVTVDETALTELIVERLSATDYKVDTRDKFITVYHPGTKIPKLVNVITRS